MGLKIHANYLLTAGLHDMSGPIFYVKNEKYIYFKRLSAEFFIQQARLYYAPRRISGEHIVAASSVRPCVRVSVRPCVRPALVHANSRKLLVGFQ